MSLKTFKRQVVILDCCFSGAFAKGFTARDSGEINLQQYLGGEGRAILTASTSTQYAFESDDFGLGIYTNYLVEGIEKGAADKNGDGWIAVDELHEYAKSKVQEESPNMTPELYYLKKGEPILLAKSPKDDPKLKYRKEFETIVFGDEGEIEEIIEANRPYLFEFRRILNLSIDDTNLIEFEVLEPHRKRQEKLQLYEQELSKIKQYPLSQARRKALKRLQNILSLRDEDVAPIEERILAKQKPPVSEEPLKAKKFEFETVNVDAQGKIIERSQGSAEFFAEDLGNGVTLEMVSIPGGKFLMGSPDNEEGRDDSESPQHNVTIQPFFMGKFPVTQAQWAAVAAFDKVNIDLKSDPSRFKGANRPVERISWDDAVEFCTRLSKKTGQIYRLPSEAEWEYACRGGTTTPFYCGATITTELANYDGNHTYGSSPRGEYRGQTTNVGEFPANPFGLFDMCGNIWEWCQDEWQENYNNAPTDGSAWLINNDNQRRLLRGGSWNYYPRGCRSLSRLSNTRDDRNERVGCRVVVVRGRLS